MKRSAASPVPLVLLLLAVATASAAATGGMAGAAEAEHAANYLVYVNPHPPGVDCQAYQLGILAAALGRHVHRRRSLNECIVGTEISP
jgi:hypothetical protein